MERGKGHDKSLRIKFPDCVVSGDHPAVSAIFNGTSGSLKLIMKLTLDALLVLDAIDRKGSFAAAAEELFRVPSAVTYTIRKLEQELDLTLFDRTGHKAVLTAAGKKLLDDGRILLRAASQLESSVKRTATGWETELRIALSDILPLDGLLELVECFYQEHSGTRLRIVKEVLQGGWDALISDRADLAIGIPGMGPPGGGYTTVKLGTMSFDFIVPRGHPLISCRLPLSESDILNHRAVAAADSSRHLPVLTTALLSGQEVLTMPGMAEKYQAHLAGLGVGYVPSHLAARDIEQGLLEKLPVASPPPPAELYIAWSTKQHGNALQWFIDRLQTASPWNPDSWAVTTK